MENNIFIKLYESLQYVFIQKALLTGSFVALSCSLLGVHLILRRFSLIGDGLSHVSLATIALGLLLGVSPIYISIPLVMMASLLILKLSEKTTMHGDTAIGLISSFGIAMGVLIASIAGGFNVDLFSYLFGSILSINSLEVLLSIILSIIIAGTIIFFHSDLFSLSFDEEFARASGIKTQRLNRLLILLTSVTIVLGIRVVGTLLVSSLIIIPAVTALQIAKSFKKTLIYGATFAVISVIIGIFISYILNLPTGATIVMVNFCWFVIVYSLKKII